MANIYPGAALVIDTGTAQETVIVTGTTATNFTANTSSAHDGTGTPFPIVSDPLLAGGGRQLEAASQQAVAPFFATYPELQPLYDAYVASADPVPASGKALLDAFLPMLKTSASSSRRWPRSRGRRHRPELRQRAAYRCRGHARRRRAPPCPRSPT